MKITDLRKQKLTEASYRYVSKSRGIPGVGFSGSARSIPSIFIVSEDGYDLESSNKFKVILIKPRTGDRKFYEIVRNGLEHANRENAYFTTIWRNLQMKELNSDTIDMMKEFPSVFRVIDIPSKERLFKYLTTDQGMAEQHYKEYIGPIPEDHGEEDVIKFHGANIFFPDNMRAATRKKMIEFTDTIFQYLKASGFGFLFPGNIKFTKLPGKTMGLYENGAIVIHPNIKSDMQNVFSLLHEYAHKLWFQFMTDEMKKKVKDKFIELRRSGIKHEGIPVDYDIEEYEKQIKPGMEFKYVGRKRVFKRNGGEYIIKTVDHENGMFTAYRKDDPYKHTFVEGSLKILLTGERWKSIDPDFKYIPKAKHKGEYVGDTWFPTNYSMTDPEEWWSELMGFFLLGKIGEEQEQFIHEVLGV